MPRRDLFPDWCPAAWRPAHHVHYEEGTSIMPIVAHTRPFVIGVDAHARNHALAILACPAGEVVDEAQFPATVAGLQRAVGWVARRTGGDVDALWVIEGVGT